jgi:hypothetical protein
MHDEHQLVSSLLVDFGYSSTIDHRWQWVMESFPGELPQDIHDRLLMKRNYSLSMATDQFIALETTTPGTPFHELVQGLYTMSIFQLRQKEFEILNYQFLCGSITVEFSDDYMNEYFILSCFLYKIMSKLHIAFIHVIKQKKKRNYPPHPKECYETATFKEKVKYIVEGIQYCCEFFRDKLPLVLGDKPIDENYFKDINKLLTHFIVNIDKVIVVVNL